MRHKKRKPKKRRKLTTTTQICLARLAISESGNTELGRSIVKDLELPDNFLYLGLLKQDNKLAIVGTFEGDPLSYIGVPENVSEKLLFKLLKEWDEIKAGCKLYLQNYQIIGTHQQIKVVNECLRRFWETELETGGLYKSADEIEEHWNIEI